MYFGAPTAWADPVAAGLVILAAVLTWFLPRIAAVSALVGGVIGYSVATEPLLTTSLAGLIGVIVLVRHRLPALAVVPAVVLASAAASWSRYDGLDTRAWLGELFVATAVTSAVAGASLSRRSRADAVLADKRLREQQVAAEQRDAILTERARRGGALGLGDRRTRRDGALRRRPASPRGHPAIRRDRRLGPGGSGRAA